jgi:hypothetical protein
LGPLRPRASPARHRIIIEAIIPQVSVLPAAATRAGRCYRLIHIGEPLQVILPRFWVDDVEDFAARSSPSLMKERSTLCCSSEALKKTQMGPCWPTLFVSKLS